MRITFDDRSYVEFNQSPSSDKISIALGSIKHEDGKRVISVSSAEVTREQFMNLLGDIKFPLKVVERNSGNAI